MAISDVEVFDDGRFTANADVAVRDSLIEAAAVGAALPADPRTDEGGNRRRIPGLIDAHTHDFGTARSDDLRFGLTAERDISTHGRLVSDARHDWQEIGIPLSRFEDADRAGVRGLAFTAKLAAVPLAIDLGDVRIQ